MRFARLASCAILATATLAACSMVRPDDTAKLSEADRGWIAACVKQLADEPAPSEAVKQRYCTCMHQQFDDNKPVRQSEMERLYPPMHRACNREAGWK